MSLSKRKIAATFLTGKTIYLRGLKEEDLSGGYVSWLNDTEVCQYNSHHVFPYSVENVRSYIRESSQAKNALVLAIILKQSNRHIGNISLQNINYINRSAEFAVLLGDKKYWGKGIAKEASRLIVEHGFKELNLNRIYCGTSADNIVMQRLARFLGMSKEGVRRQALYKHGRFVNIIEYGLLKAGFSEHFGNKDKLR